MLTRGIAVPALDDKGTSLPISSRVSEPESSWAWIKKHLVTFMVCAALYAVTQLRFGPATSTLASLFAPPSQLLGRPGVSCPAQSPALKLGSDWDPSFDEKYTALAVERLAGAVQIVSATSWHVVGSH